MEDKMNQNELMKQMVKSNQMIFDSALEASALIEDQVEKFGDVLLDQAYWLPDDGRKMVNSYRQAYKTGRDHFKNYVDASYERVEKFFK
jgi:uncharacterized protein Yka (UPF0111/DUF47 family)